MTGKVKIPQNVADAIEKLRRVYSKYGVISVVANQKSEYPTLSNSIDVLLVWTHEEEGDGLNADRLVDLLANGYEIAEEYKVGDWFFCPSPEEIGQLKDDEKVHWSDGIKTSLDYTKELIFAGNVRRATPKEIKAEKERRIFAKLGREVGEFRDGDIGVGSSGAKWSDIIHLKKAYEDGGLKGFYPAESFISFGGGEE